MSGASTWCGRMTRCTALRGATDSIFATWRAGTTSVPISVSRSVRRSSSHPANLLEPPHLLERPYPPHLLQPPHLLEPPYPPHPRRRSRLLHRHPRLPW